MVAKRLYGLLLDWTDAMLIYNICTDLFEICTASTV